MNATISNSAPASAISWKAPTLVLAIIAAALAATAGVESYLLYRAHRPAAAVTAKEATSAGSQAPSIHAPKYSWDDWAGPLASGSPWDQLNALHQQMDQMFNNTLNRFPMDPSALLSGLSSPNFDLREEGDHYTIRADMPGTDKSSIKVNVEGRLVTIAGERTALNQTTSDNKVIRSERNMARFERTIQLPGPVKAASVDAKYDNGVLTLTLPKADQGASSTLVPVR